MKMLNPNNRVIATESPDTIPLLEHNLQGSGVEVHSDWSTLAPKLADETWAVAPQPSQYENRAVANAGVNVTKSGGQFHIVVSQNEQSNVIGMLNYLEQISGGQATADPTMMGVLGIPSEYYGSSEPVWHIILTLP